MVSPRIMGVKLFGASSDCTGQFIKTIHETPNTRISEIRQILVNEGIATALGDKNFAFLSKQGFKINPKIEYASIYDILQSDDSIHICVDSDKPCLGIKIKCGTGVSIEDALGDCVGDVKGFVYCDLSSALANLVEEIRVQLPDLYESVSKFEVVFLDQNGWPISKKQEESLTVVETCVSSCITLCLLQSSPDKKVSNHSVSPEKKETDKCVEEDRKLPESPTQSTPTQSTGDIGLASPSLPPFTQEAMDADTPLTY